MALAIRRGLPALLFLIIYIAMANLGLRYATLPGEITPIWPVSGIVLAVLAISSPRYGWAVLVGDLLVGLSIGIPPLIAFCLSSGTALEAVAAALVLRKICHEYPEADRVRDVIGVLAGATLGPMIGATIATITLLTSGRVIQTEAYLTWLGWWAADAVGMLIITPLILAWLTFRRRPLVLALIIESCFLAAITIVLTLFIFDQNLNAAYLLFVVATWVALRFSIRGVTLFLIGVSLIAIQRTLYGSAPAQNESIGESLVFLQALLAALSTTTLILHALTNERRRTAAAVQLMADIGDFFMAPVDMHQALRQVALRLTRSFANACAIDLIEAHGQRQRTTEIGLSHIRWSGLTACDADWMQAQMDSVLVSGQSQLFNNLHGELIDRLFALLTRRYMPHTNCIRAALFVPIGLPAQTVGVTALLATVAQRRYRQSDLTTLHELSTRIAQAVLAARLEAHLVQSQRFEALGRMAGGVAHDFNNLLTLIRGNVQLAREALEGQPAILHDMDEIEQVTDRASRLVQQLLVVGRQQPIARVPTNVNHMIEQAMPLINRLVGAAIQIEYRLSKQIDLTLLDPIQFEQVILNLAINARDAMPNGGHLRVETGVTILDRVKATGYGVQPGRYMHLHIADTGSGIPPQVLHRIFEPFFTTKGPGRGTGLGLAICQSIISQCGGRITVVSEPDAGTMVTILLPAAPPAHSSTDSQ